MEKIDLETIIDELEIEAGKKNMVIYDIHYCKAGVGFCMHDGDRYTPEFKDVNLGDIVVRQEDNWKKGLVTDRYYPTLREAATATLKLVKDK